MIMSFYESNVFPWVLKVADRAFRREREEILGSARGRILEIGIGSGISLPFYSAQVEQVVGIEPSEALLLKAHQAAKNVPAMAGKVSLQAGDAQDLQFADNSFDCVVAFLVFCTIPDPEKAAKEVFRVLKPGGSLIFFEHVQAPSERLARWQNRLNPVWNKLGCGCNLNRTTQEVFEQQGFHFESIDAFYHPKIIRLVSPVIKGVAKKC